MRNMYHLLLTLIRKLCAIVRPVLNWSSHSSTALLLNRLWSLTLRASRPLTSKSPSNDAGDPFPAVLLPSAAASMIPCVPERTPSEVEDGLPEAAVDRISTEPARSPRITERNDNESESLSPWSHMTYFLPMLPSESERYNGKTIMCVCHIPSI